MTKSNTNILKKPLVMVPLVALILSILVFVYSQSISISFKLDENKDFSKEHPEITEGFYHLIVKNTGPGVAYIKSYTLCVNSSGRKICLDSDGDIDGDGDNDNQDKNKLWYKQLTSINEETNKIFPSGVLRANWANIDNTIEPKGSIWILTYPKRFKTEFEKIVSLEINYCNSLGWCKLKPNNHWQAP